MSGITLLCISDHLSPTPSASLLSLLTYAFLLNSAKLFTSLLFIFNGILIGYQGTASLEVMAT